MDLYSSSNILIWLNSDKSIDWKYNIKPSYMQTNLFWSFQPHGQQRANVDLVLALVTAICCKQETRAIVCANRSKNKNKAIRFRNFLFRYARIEV